MKKFEEWLAVSPLASVIKISIGAALGAVGSWVTTADIHPLIVAVSAAVIPVLVNALNPADPRWGLVDWDEFNG